MTDEQQSNKTKESFSFCEGMPFAEMMRKMMDQEGACCGVDCPEMMSQMMQQMKAGGDPMAMCQEMTKKMKGACC